MRLMSTDTASCTTAHDDHDVSLVRHNCARHHHHRSDTHLVQLELLVDGEALLEHLVLVPNGDARDLRPVKVVQAVDVVHGTAWLRPRLVRALDGRPDEQVLQVAVLRNIRALRSHARAHRSTPAR
jgi:hypothetical protein